MYCAATFVDGRRRHVACHTASRSAPAAASFLQEAKQRTCRQRPARLSETPGPGKYAQLESFFPFICHLSSRYHTANCRHNLHTNSLSSAQNVACIHDCRLCLFPLLDMGTDFLTVSPQAAVAPLVAPDVFPDMMTQLAQRA